MVLEGETLSTNPLSPSFKKIFFYINFSCVCYLQYYYFLDVDGNVPICPRSDPDVPSWEFLFTVNLNTSFCSADQFDRSVVCYETNSLKFSNLTGFHNQIGSINFFDMTFDLNVTVLYGKYLA